MGKPLTCIDCARDFPRREQKQGRQAQRCQPCKLKLADAKKGPGRRRPERIYGSANSCEGCGGIFTRKGFRTYRFCSISCSHSGRSMNFGRATVTCLVCNKQWETTTCVAKRSKYCSLRCGKTANPHWQGTASQRRRPKRAYSQQCRVCEGSFLSNHPKSTCSERCLRAIAQQQKKPRHCIGCGKTFYRSRSGRRRAKYCTNDCARVTGRSCADCGTQYRGAAWSKTCKSCAQAKATRPKVTLTCSECGTAFTATEKRKFCNTKCLRRASGRNSKAARRAAKKGGTAERISPKRVFERDGWRCYMCGCATPKGLMGNIRHPKAPTLDHVVAIAKGGHHTYSNVRTACRLCNSRKSDGPPINPSGQVLLCA